MAGASIELARFNGGELSPYLQGRVDLERYRASCRELLNVIPLAEGAATRRPGTRFVQTVPAEGAVRCIEFQFTTGDAYMLVLTPNLISFFADGGSVAGPGGNPLTLAHPYSAVDLLTVDYCQSADVLLLFHRKHPIQALRRTGPNTFTLTPFELSDGPFGDLNTSALTITPSATTGASVTLTASANLFNAATDIGRHVRIRHGTTWGSAVITAVTSPTQATARVDADFPFGATTASKSWRLGAFYTGNYPASGTFYEQRLWVGGTTNAVQTLWGSVVGAFNQFSLSAADGNVRDDAGIQFTIDDDEVNDIIWLAATRTLLIGTANGIFTAQSTRLAEPIAPSNITVRRMSTVGSSYVGVARINASVFYGDFTRKRIHEVTYNYQEDAYVTPELSLLASHMTQPRVRQVTYQEHPWRCLWAVRDDGALIGCTYLREQEVRGWHRHRIAGKVEAIGVVRETVGDILWMVVRRTVQGVEQRHVEYMTGEFVPPDVDGTGGTPLEDACYVDASLAYAGAPVDRLTGLDHLEGLEVTILAGGAVHPKRVVQQGAIDLAWKSGKVVVGLAVPFRLETLNLELPVGAGTTKGRPRHAARVVAWLVATGAGHRIGGNLGPLDPILTRAGGQPMDRPPALLQGPVRLTLPMGVGIQTRLVVEGDDPTPCALASLTPDVWIEVG